MGDPGAVGPHLKALKPAAEHQRREPVPELMRQRRQQEERPREVPSEGDQIESQGDGGAHQEHFARDGIRPQGH